MKTTDTQHPKVGILADDLVQQHNLRNALTGFGLEVITNISPLQQSYSNLATYPDVWVVDVHGEDDDTLAWLDALLSNDHPVLFGIDSAPQRQSADYAKWEKKLYSKLCSLNLAMPAPAEQSDKSPDTLTLNTPEVFSDNQFDNTLASQVWVIAASMGGPDAVKVFFDTLPEGLPIGFIYAQHIDPAFEDTLGQTIGRHCYYKFKNFIEGDAINCGDVLIAPIQSEFSFDPQLRLKNEQTQWPGPYGPSIDQVIKNVNSAYGCDAGYIVFSGMGEDGSEGITNLTAPEIPIWAQQPDSCICSSMPENAIATGKVSYIGTPQQLAKQLVQYVQQQWETNHV